MGGQTALNLCMDCEKAGLRRKHNIRVIGSDFAAIDKAEDRELFRVTMNEMGLLSVKLKQPTLSANEKKLLSASDSHW